MKSIKPGRGVSKLSHSGAVFGIIFGVFWTLIAFGMAAMVFSSEAPGMMKFFIIIFPAFGIMFVVMGIKQSRFHKHNATSRNRHSIIDITSSDEERDPLDRWSRTETEFNQANRFSETSQFCSNCGHKLGRSHNFCPTCGKKVT